MHGTWVWQCAPKKRKRTLKTHTVSCCWMENSRWGGSLLLLLLLFSIYSFLCLDFLAWTMYYVHDLIIECSNLLFSVLILHLTIQCDMHVWVCICVLHACVGDVCVCVQPCSPWCGGQRVTFRHCLFPSALWIPYWTQTWQQVHLVSLCWSRN